MSRLSNLLNQLTACSVPEATRCLSLQFLNGKDWSTVTAFCEALQNDLDWPPPMLSVHPAQGFKVWLVFAEALPLSEAHALAAALLAELLPENFGPRLQIAFEQAVGPQENEAGLWSAFIDPSMGSMFVEQQGLDIEPHPDRQAELLSLVRPIPLEDVRRWLGEASRSPATSPCVTTLDCVAPQIALEFPVFDDPRVFLRAVMNDARQNMTDRLRAAELLLQHRD